LRAEIGKINDKILPRANQNFKGSPNFTDFQCFIFQFGGIEAFFGWLSGEGSKFWVPVAACPPQLGGMERG